MNPDFLETEAFQKRAACRVLRKYPAGKLVHPSCRRCFDQRCKGRAIGAAAAMIAPEQGAYSLPPAYSEQAVRDVALQFSRAGVRLVFVLNQALAADAN